MTTQPDAPHQPAPQPEKQPAPTTPKDPTISFKGHEEQA